MKYTDIKTKKAKIQHIRTMLGTNLNWASKGVIRIFENQTADEQNVEDTVENNGIGFTGADANILTSFAKQIIKGRTLSPKQQAILFKKMPKYSTQLERMTKDTVKAQPETTNPVELNLKAIDDKELLALFYSLQGSIQYYEAAEGNYGPETTARNECYKEFDKAVKEAEHRGLL